MQAKQTASSRCVEMAMKNSPYISYCSYTQDLKLIISQMRPPDDIPAFVLLHVLGRC